VARITGDGVGKDVKAGIEQLDSLCTRGEPTGCESLAGLYAKGNGADVPADPLRTREYAKKACDLGAKGSCAVDRLLGTIDNGDTAAGQVNALLQLKCDGGDFTACGMLGEDLLGGLGANVDRVKGTALLDRACKGGFERACKRLAKERGQSDAGSVR
jgi:TPR repeat protein